MTLLTQFQTAAKQANLSAAQIADFTLLSLKQVQAILQGDETPTEQALELLKLKIQVYQSQDPITLDQLMERHHVKRVYIAPDGAVGVKRRWKTTPRSTTYRYLWFRWSSEHGCFKPARRKYPKHNLPPGSRPHRLRDPEPVLPKNTKRKNPTNKGRPVGYKVPPTNPDYQRYRPLLIGAIRDTAQNPSRWVIFTPRRYTQKSDQ